LISFENFSILTKTINLKRIEKRPYKKDMKIYNPIKQNRKKNRLQP